MCSGADNGKTAELRDGACTLLLPNVLSSMRVLHAVGCRTSKTNQEQASQSIEARSARREGPVQIPFNFRGGAARTAVHQGRVTSNGPRKCLCSMGLQLL